MLHIEGVLSVGTGQLASLAVNGGKPLGELRGADLWNPRLSGTCSPRAYSCEP